MDIHGITPNVSVTGQIKPDDVAELRAKGFKAIIGNRPDGESEDQPAWSEVSAAADEAGMATAYIPVTPGQMSDDQALAFREAVSGFDKPVLAFCRTGTRSAHLWALAARDRLSTDEVIRMAAAAGYDVSDMRDRLNKGI